MKRLSKLETVTFNEMENYVQDAFQTKPYELMVTGISLGYKC